MGEKKKAGYEYLLAYKLTVPIYDYTVTFCDRWINKRSRTHDQMVQAARSGMQNIPEGYSQESLAGYIKLSGVSHGSLEELLKDYLSYARQHKIPLWEKERVVREIGELRELWGVLRRTPTLPDTPNFPKLPEDPEKAVNLMVTLIHQASYLVKKLIQSLEAKHEKEGGFSEKLLKRRLEYRRGRGSGGSMGPWGDRGKG
jgi:four helix bundle suffix protein